MKQIFTKKLTNSDNQPFLEIASMLYSKSTQLITSILSILPKWIVFVALIFPITGSAFAQEQPLVVNLEQGLVLEIYSNKYVVYYNAPDYSIVHDTIKSNSFSGSSSTPPIFNEDNVILDRTEEIIFDKIEFAWGEYMNLDSIGMPKLPYRQLELFLPKCYKNHAIEVSMEESLTKRIFFGNKYSPSIAISSSYPSFNVEISPYYETDGSGFYDNYYEHSNIY